MSVITGWAGVVLLTISGAMAAWLEALYVPYYLGATIAPVTLVFVAATSWYLPRLARVLVPSTFAALLPFLAWLAVILIFGASTRPEGDVILPGGGTAAEYVGYGVMLIGILVGVVSIVLSAPVRPRR